MAAEGWWIRLLLVRGVAGALVGVALVACGVSFKSGELKRPAGEGKLAQGPVTRGEAVPIEKASPVLDRAKTWEEIAALLPKDKAGHVDWVQALEVGAIDPRPGLDPAAPTQLVLDLDVDLASSRSKLFTVTFPHEAHTQWLRCKNCHSAIFPLRRLRSGPAPAIVTMSKIRAGQYCGACHGRVSFGVKEECGRCHTKIPAKTKWRPSEEPQKPIERAKTWTEAEKLVPMTGGMPDWVKALAEGVISPRPGIDPNAGEQPIFPLDVELVPTDNPIFKVVFPHGPHTTLLACTNCHFGIFQMAAGADPITMDKIYRGEYCGQCHGKVAFAVPTGCPRCHPVLRGQ